LTIFAELISAMRAIMTMSSAITQDDGLHSFVKLAIAYIGIMIGFAVLGTLFYVIAAQGEAPGSAPVALADYYSAIGYFATLITVCALALRGLVKAKKTGAYFAFAALAISLLAPHMYGGLGIVYWFAIPNAVVGILLARSWKSLH
jgi:hypothetical protein